MGGSAPRESLSLDNWGPHKGWAATLCSSLGSNAEIRRGVLSFKLSRFVECHTAYPVEVSVCGHQLREPLLPHKGHDKGIVRQQPFALPNLGACLHDVER